MREAKFELLFQSLPAFLTEITILAFFLQITYKLENPNKKQAANLLKLSKTKHCTLESVQTLYGLNWTICIYIEF